MNSRAAQTAGSAANQGHLGAISFWVLSSIASARRGRPLCSTRQALGIVVAQLKRGACG